MDSRLFTNPYLWDGRAGDAHSEPSCEGETCVVLQSRRFREPLPRVWGSACRCGSHAAARFRPRFTPPGSPSPKSNATTGARRGTGSYILEIRNGTCHSFRGACGQTEDSTDLPAMQGDRGPLGGCVQGPLPADVSPDSFGKFCGGEKWQPRQGPCWCVNVGPHGVPLWDARAELCDKMSACPQKTHISVHLVFTCRGLRGDP